MVSELYSAFKGFSGRVPCLLARGCKGRARARPSRDHIHSGCLSICTVICVFLIFVLHIFTYVTSYNGYICGFHGQHTCMVESRDVRELVNLRGSSCFPKQARTIGALIIRIGFSGPLYYKYHKKHPKIVLVVIQAPRVAWAVQELFQEYEADVENRLEDYKSQATPGPRGLALGLAKP